MEGNISNIGIGDIKDHEQAINVLLAKISDLSEIKLIGHRVVHGGGYFVKPIVIDKNNLKKLEQYNFLAPLHNPANIMGIKACLKLLPKIKNHPLIKPQKDTPQNILYLNTLVGRGGAAKITYDMVAKNIINRGYDAKLLVDEVFKNINDERVSKIEKKYSKESKLLSRYQYNNGWLDFFHDSNFEIKNNTELGKNILKELKRF